MTRFVDRGATVAAFVGIGMAVTIGISFLLIIPIEPIYWYLTLPAGLLIGYYANQRSGRAAGPIGRILVNALFAGAVTGLTMAVLLLAVKVLFFSADTGYRDAGLGGSLTCETGAGCVYQRYLAEGHGDALREIGVTDAASFSSFYWGQQLSTAGLLLAATTVTGLVGGGLYVIVRPRPGGRREAPATGQAPPA